MGMKLAPTTFATGAEEQLVAVDAYAIDTANEINNALPDVNNQLSLAGLAGLRGGNLSGALKYVVQKGGGIQVDANSLLQGVISANPALNSAVASLTGSVKTSILSNAGYSNVTATINGISSSINNTDLRSLTSVGAMIGGLTGTSFPISFTDVRGLTNLTTNIVAQAVNMGIPDAYKSIAVGLTNTPIMRAVTQDLAPIIINRSATNLMSNVAQSPYSRQLTASRPQFVQEYSRQYQAPLNTPKTSTYRPTIQSIGSSFNQIQPGWQNSRALGGSAAGSLNLSRATDVSDDFDLLLQANAGFASVKVPSSNYATMDTSCRAVASTPNLPYDMNLAQMSALKSALPSDTLGLLADAKASLRESFPFVVLA